VAFSPDGQTLASGTGYDLTLVLWDMASIRMVAESQLSAPLPSSAVPIGNLAYSPDGRTLALVCENIVLWNVTGDQPLGLPLTGHPPWSVNSIAFSPDGRILASGSGDHTIMLWDTDFESWQARACRRANRNFSRAEWQQFFGDQPYRATCPDLPTPEEQDSNQ
jgi:WD40 repeat protein